MCQLLRCCVLSLLLLAVACIWTPNASAQGNFLYYTDFGDDRVLEKNLDDANPPTSLTSFLSPIGIAIDTKNGQLFWTNNDAEGSLIRQTDIATGNTVTLISGLANPSGIALDLINGHIYWTDLTTINRADIDGTGSTTLFTGLGLADGIELDVVNGHIYFTDRLAATPSIRRGNMDGTGLTDLVTNLTNPVGLDLDLVNGHIYWTDSNEGSVWRSDLDGSNAAALSLSLSMLNPLGIALDLNNGHMYIADSALNSIFRYDLDGSNATTPVSGLPGTADPRDVALDIPPPPEPTLDMAKIDYGYLPVGNSDEEPFDITNTGGSDLSVEGITAPTAPFRITQVTLRDDNNQEIFSDPLDQVSFPVTVSPDYKIVVDVIFEPVQGNEDTDFTDQVTVSLSGFSDEMIDLCGTTNIPAQLNFTHAFGAPGGVAVVSMELINNVPVAGFQFDLLPVDDGSTEPVPSDHVLLEGIVNRLESLGFSTFYSTDGETGISTVIFAGLGGEFLDPGQWDVLDLVFNIDGQAPHFLCVNILLDTVVLSDPDNQGIEPFGVSLGKVQVGEPGDLAGGELGNGDGQINILDVVKVIKYIIGQLPLPTDPFQFWLVDVNDDELINILDLIAIINAYLGPPETAKAIPVGSAIVSLNTVMQGPGDQIMVPLMFHTDGPVAAAQAAFTFDPTMLRIGPPVLTDRAPNLSLQHTVENGTLRIIVYSTEGAVIPAGNDAAVLIPVTLLAEGIRTPVFTMEQVILSDISANEIPVTPGETSVKVATLPTAFSLDANAPNPFNPSTTIAYEVPQQTHIQLIVYNLLGQEVVRLVDRVQTPGRYEVRWDARNAFGQAVSSGIYMYRLVSGTGYQATHRMTLLK